VSSQQPGKPLGGPPGYGLPPQRPPQQMWRTKKNGRTVYRNFPPLILWWGWVIFTLLNLIDIIATGVDHGARIGAALLLFVTGVIYACTLHSRVESDAEGVTVYNPLFEHHAPWGGVEGIYVGDSVEFCCSRPAPQKAKTIYSWALYSRRRSQARSQLQRSMFNFRGAGSRDPIPVGTGAKQQPSEVMAAELARRCKEAKEAGAEGGFLRTTWSWVPVAAMAAPAVLVLLAWFIT
jgi:hypothetical protein